MEGRYKYGKETYIEGEIHRREVYTEGRYSESRLTRSIYTEGSVHKERYTEKGVTVYVWRRTTH